MAQADAEERARIVAALEATGWNRKAAAAKIGQPRRSFYRALERLNVLPIKG